MGCHDDGVRPSSHVGKDTLSNVVHMQEWVGLLMEYVGGEVVEVKSRVGG